MIIPAYNRRQQSPYQDWLEAWQNWIFFVSFRREYIFAQNAVIIHTIRSPTPGFPKAIDRRYKVPMLNGNSRGVPGRKTRRDGLLDLLNLLCCWSSQFFFFAFQIGHLVFVFVTRALWEISWVTAWAAAELGEVNAFEAVASWSASTSHAAHLAHEVLVIRVLLLFVLVNPLF
jgi:hypothetical protein